MPHTPGTPPVISRPDVEAVLVEMIATEDAEAQHRALDAVRDHWSSAPWPEELVAASGFSSTDGGSVLTYQQWASRGALLGARRAEGGIADRAPGLDGPGAAAQGPTPFRLYRVVRGGAVPDPAPVPACFPAAVFPIGGEDAARKWIDGLLAAEEENEGGDRAYPGAIAANFHVGLDGGGVLVLSEWVSEQEAADHIDEVIAPLLDAAGGGDAGARYTHRFTHSGPV